MAAAKSTQPKITSMTVSYNVGTKVNLGDFESADFHLSKSETWDTSGLTPDQVKALWRERYHSMRQELGDEIQWEREEVLGEHLPQVEERSK